MFHYPYQGSHHQSREYILYYLMNLLPSLVLTISNLTAVCIIKPRIKKIMDQTANHPSLDTKIDNQNSLSYATYGLPWGIATSVTILTVVLFALDIHTTVTVLPSYSSIPVAYLMVLNFMAVPTLPTIIPTFYIWKSLRKRKWEIPYVFQIPAIILCLGNKRKGRELVLGFVVYVFLVFSGMLGIHGVAIAITSVASFHAVGLSTTILILVIVSTTDIFALLYTVGAYCCNKPHLRSPGEKKIIVNTLILIPLLIALIVICLIPLTCCNSVTVQINQNTLMSTLGSLPSPVIGMMVVFGQRKLITFAMRPKAQDSHLESRNTICTNASPEPKIPLKLDMYANKQLITQETLL